MQILKVGTPFYHHQSGPGELYPDLVAKVDAASLVDLLLQEGWKGQCEIIPDYMPEHPRPETRPMCIVRYFFDVGDNPHRENGYCYLRYSQGPRQGFFWDMYGDDLQTIELAILALSKAPCPTYCGPTIHKIRLPAK